jgi:hypothetical protein
MMAFMMEMNVLDWMKGGWMAMLVIGLKCLLSFELDEVN